MSEPLRHSKEARSPGVELSSHVSRSQPGVDSSSRPLSFSFEDTFKGKLNKSKEGSRTLADFKSLVLSAQLSEEVHQAALINSHFEEDPTVPPEAQVDFVDQFKL